MNDYKMLAVTLLEAENEEDAIEMFIDCIADGSFRIEVEEINKEGKNEHQEIR